MMLHHGQKSFGWILLKHQAEGHFYAYADLWQEILWVCTENQLLTKDMFVSDFFFLKWVSQQSACCDLSMIHTVESIRNEISYLFKEIPILCQIFSQESWMLMFYLLKNGTSWPFAASAPFPLALALLPHHHLSGLGIWHYCWPLTHPKLIFFVRKQTDLFI